MARETSKRDLDVANLQPALDQGWGKQSPRAGILFFRWHFISTQIRT